MCYLHILQDKWQPLLSTVTGVHKYKWLKQNVQGLYPQSALLNTIVEFALKEEPVDVEKMVKWIKIGITVPAICSSTIYFLFPFCSWKEQKFVWKE